MNNERPTIEKGVPLPEARTSSRGHWGETRDTLLQMEVGDSFLIEIDSELASKDRQKEIHRNRNRYDVAAKKLGYAITTRSDPRGARLWRVR